MLIFSILNHPRSFWFILAYLVFVDPGKWLFQGFILFKGNSLCDAKNDSK